MWDQISDLHACHREVPVETRLLEADRGDRRGRGSVHRHARPELAQGGLPAAAMDLLAELADVIITAAVAMTGVTGGDVEEARSHLEQRLTVVTERARR